MKTKIITALVVAIGALTLAANAQDNNDGPPGGGGPGGPGRHHRPPPLPIVTALDVNHNGVIDSSEIASASAELLTLDKNSDGILTTNEYLPPLPKDAPADAPRPPMPQIVKALDANSDGVIDASEIANAPAALQTLDKNGDGKLTRDEYLGPRPPRPNNQNAQDHGPGGDEGYMGGPPPDDGNGNTSPSGPPPGDN